MNTYTVFGDQRTPDVSIDGGGAFAITWDDNQDGWPPGVFVQPFDSTGTRQGRPFMVNTFTPRNQAYSSVASDADGNYVVVWSSYIQEDKYGVFGQRLTTPTPHTPRRLLRSRLKGKGPNLPDGAPGGLQTTTSVTMQLRASDADCVSVTLGTIKRQDVDFFKAQ